MSESIVWEKFIYDFKFNTGLGWKVKVTIDFEFDDVVGLETISRFPHGQRRAFAQHVLDKYSAETFHLLAQSDIINPFAARLNRLFNHGMQAYWIRRPTDTVLILTGFVQTFSQNYFLKQSLPLCVEL